MLVKNIIDIIALVNCNLRQEKTMYVISKYCRPIRLVVGRINQDLPTCASVSGDWRQGYDGNKRQALQIVASDLLFIKKNI